jgi:hypothetical protein
LIIEYKLANSYFNGMLRYTTKIVISFYIFRDYVSRKIKVDHTEVGTQVGVNVTIVFDPTNISV